MLLYIAYICRLWELSFNEVKIMCAVGFLWVD